MPDILVVDDEQEMRDALVMALEYEGYSVAEATGGREGIEKANKIIPSVILLDIFMPGISGWETLRIIRSMDRLKDIPVIIVTGMPGARKYFDEKLPRNCAFFAKPFDMEDLLSQIEEFMDFGNIKEEINACTDGQAKCC